MGVFITLLQCCDQRSPSHWRASQMSLQDLSFQICKPHSVDLLSPAEKKSPFQWWKTTIEHSRSLLVDYFLSLFILRSTIHPLCELSPYSWQLSIVEKEWMETDCFWHILETRFYVWCRPLSAALLRLYNCLWFTATEPAYLHISVWCFAKIVLGSDESQRGLVYLAHVCGIVGAPSRKPSYHPVCVYGAREDTSRFNKGVCVEDSGKVEVPGYISWRLWFTGGRPVWIHLERTFENFFLRNRLTPLLHTCKSKKKIKAPRFEVIRNGF